MYTGECMHLDMHAKRIIFTFTVYYYKNHLAQRRQGECKEHTDALLKASKRRIMEADK